VQQRPLALDGDDGIGLDGRLGRVGRQLHQSRPHQQPTGPQPQGVIEALDVIEAGEDATELPTGEDGLLDAEPAGHRDLGLATLEANVSDGCPQRGRDLLLPRRRGFRCNWISSGWTHVEPRPRE